MLVIGGDRVGLDAILRILNSPEDAPVLPVSEGEGDPGEGSVSVPSSSVIVPGPGTVAQAYSANPLGVQ